GEALGEGEAEAEAAVLAGRRLVGHPEGLEEAGLRLRRDADAGVRDREEEVAALVDHLLVDAELDPALVGELAGVREEVEEDPVELGPIGLDVADLAAVLELEGVVVLAGEGQGGGPQRLDELD